MQLANKLQSTKHHVTIFYGIIVVSTIHKEYLKRAIQALISNGIRFQIGEGR